MNLAAKVLVVLVYPMLMLGRALNALLDRDPLRIRPQNSESLWIQRGPAPGIPSYFSEASEVEGKGHRGFGHFAGATFRAAAMLFAARREAEGRDVKLEGNRERGLPDEIYTLW